MSNPGLHSIIGVTTSGIQDISALLPLLGTQQCEHLVTSALQDGLFYAAAAPMSMFGSLGIVKAGFMVLCISIDTWFFPGPRFLANAGFSLSGASQLLGRNKGGNLSVAEEKIQTLLANKSIRSVTVKLFSTELVVWHLMLISLTASLGIFGLVPYLTLIKKDLPNQPFHSTWLYPVCRVVGCSVVVITIQLILQLRIIQEIYYSARFMRVSEYLRYENEGRLLRPLFPPFWDSEDGSRRVLAKLESEMGSREIRRNTSENTLLQDLRALTSFVADSSADSSEGSPPARNHRAVWGYYLTAVLVIIARTVLFLGLVVTIIGYIGSFSIVQASPASSSSGPLVWLIWETVLSVIRLAIWGLAPKWGCLSPPIALERVVKANNDNDRSKKGKYGIDWTLDAFKANNIHALVIGVEPQRGNLRHTDTLGSYHKSAEHFADYLRDTLFIPSDQLVTLLGEKATKDRIIKELMGMAEKDNIVHGAPIVIFVAMEDCIIHDQYYLCPHIAVDPDQEASEPSIEDFCSKMISSEEIFDLLAQINRQRGCNITFILEVPNSLQVMVPKHYERPPNDGTKLAPSFMFPVHSLLRFKPFYHVLLAISYGKKDPAHDPKGLRRFTKALVDALEDPKLEGQYNTTYERLTEAINLRMNCKPQEAFCSLTNNKQHIFGGLLSRKLKDDDTAPILTLQYCDHNDWAPDNDLST